MRISKKSSEIKTFNNNSFASHPGAIELSEARLRRFHPNLYNVPWWAFWKGSVRRSNAFWRLHLTEHLYHGDSRAAVVVKLDPILVIAAYTDELDCVVLLSFDDSPTPEDDVKTANLYPQGLAQELKERHKLEVGSRLLTVNTYSSLKAGIARDLVLGPEQYGQYGNVYPLIADFLTDNPEVVEKRKSQIAEEEWQRTTFLAQQASAFKKGFPRDGRPLFVGKSKASGF